MRSDGHSTGALKLNVFIIYSVTVVVGLLLLVGGSLKGNIFRLQS